MKFRNGFVSNSSSSSYICDTCGQDYIGYDIELSDINMNICCNGHTFCDEHITNCLKIGDKFNTEYGLYEVITINKEKDIYNIKMESGKIIETPFSDIEFERSELPEQLCPFCNLKDITLANMVKYLQSKVKMDKHEIINEIQSKCDTYYKFIEKIHDDVK